jgi:endonuclease/exonuclease/phosphatase family metal-dependent hydrolase
MRKRILLSALFFSIFIFQSISFVQAQEKKARRKSGTVFMSYNVRNCYGVDNKVDYQRVADIISRVDPDFVAVQELDSATKRSNGVFVLKEIAQRAGLSFVFAPSMPYLDGKYGIGVLSREQPVSSQIISLPGRDEKRTLLIVEYEACYFCCTQLSLNAEDRLRSVEIINEVFTETTKPVFLAGDFNTLPESDVIKTIENRWQMLNNKALPTLPSDYPNRCTDFIFALKNPSYKFKTETSAVEKEPVASDHRPVWVLLNIKK